MTHGPLPMLPIADEELLQLFQNLIGNAIKFRGDRPPRVHISTVLNGAEWLISVEDNGMGVSEEDAPRLFSMFSRGRAAQDRPGSGIGLALCKSIVERHGGSHLGHAQPRSTARRDVLHAPGGDPNCSASAPDRHRTVLPADALGKKRRSYSGLGLQPRQPVQSGPLRRLVRRAILRAAQANRPCSRRMHRLLAPPRPPPNCVRW